MINGEEMNGKMPWQLVILIQEAKLDQFENTEVVILTAVLVEIAAMTGT